MRKAIQHRAKHQEALATHNLCLVDLRKINIIISFLVSILKNAILLATENLLRCWFHNKTGIPADFTTTINIIKLLSTCFIYFSR